jgi:hypothetical protein
MTILSDSSFFAREPYLYFEVKERSILNLAIPFATLVLLIPTTWLTAVKHESPGFFQLNKDPRFYFGRNKDSVKLPESV